MNWQKVYHAYQLALGDAVAICALVIGGMVLLDWALIWTLSLAEFSIRDWNALFTLFIVCVLASFAVLFLYRLSRKG